LLLRSGELKPFKRIGCTGFTSTLFHPILSNQGRYTEDAVPPLNLPK
jgi:hypothetical protein